MKEFEYTLNLFYKFKKNTISRITYKLSNDRYLEFDLLDDYWVVIRNRHYLCFFNACLIKDKKINHNVVIELYDYLKSKNLYNNFLSYLYQEIMEII